MTGLRGYITAIALIGAASAMAGAPAIGAAGDLLSRAAFAPVSLNALGSIHSFTPSIKDEKLSSAYARASLNKRLGNSFRFTPTSGSMSGRRSITVLVRADNGLNRKADRAGAAVDIQPLAFNLDASRGWRKFALPETVGRKPLDPVSTDLAGAKNFSLEKNTSSRMKTDIQSAAPSGGTPASQLLNADRNYSVDLGSSYSLTRNLNVTAGVRYSGPDNRIAPLTDPRQDNQAVYVGTIFKF